MVKIKTSNEFEKELDKLDKSIRIQVDKLIDKIINNPDIGKPMRHNRKGTREVYVGSFRLSYNFEIFIDTIIFLNIYHKDEQ